MLIRFVQTCGPGKYDILICPTPVINVSTSKDNEGYSDYEPRENLNSKAIKGDVKISSACNLKIMIRCVNRFMIEK